MDKEPIQKNKKDLKYTTLSDSKKNESEDYGNESEENLELGM